MAGKEITIEVFFGLITKKDKVRLPLRRKKWPTLREDVLRECVYGLPGGVIEEKDLSKVLTSDALFEEGHKKVLEETGVAVKGLPMGEPIYRTVYRPPDNEKEVWTFMIPIPPDRWDENAEMLKDVRTLDVSARQLDVLGELGFIVSSKNEMYRMAMAAIYLEAQGGQERFYASGLLTQVKTDWEETELFYNTDEALADFREELGVEDINVSLSRGKNL
jgi:hypothetical protein